MFYVGNPVYLFACIVIVCGSGNGARDYITQAALSRVQCLTMRYPGGSAVLAVASGFAGVVTSSGRVAAAVRRRFSGVS
ncbi:hypothetical protein NDU88_002127 [Pleurodeles waltl]|uniref:Uncharacterized protein n=1 Tax=Pleurodeles waltl TaxID=8319 RepID=A0AAV7TJQ5_PLEWA|nr:hypothetical protein NDU88_002127 [Pleurodeles waltl]